VWGLVKLDRLRLSMQYLDYSSNDGRIWTFISQTYQNSRLALSGPILPGLRLSSKSACVRDL